MMVMTESPAQDTYEFDVAVSFAGEDREFVEEVVAQLKEAGLRVFYDSDHVAEMWGEDLIEYLDDIYRLKARYTMVFISRSYAGKMWTRHERRSALARALEQTTPYVLPVRLDDTVLKGFRPTVGYLDARKLGLSGIVRVALTKLATGKRVAATDISRVPRTEIERQQVLAERPPGWEYLYFAGQLLHERDVVEAKYHDHEIRYTPPTGEFVDAERVMDYLHRSLIEIGNLAANFNIIMDAEAQERAFGAPGEPGDTDRLAHLAKRWNGLYEGFMDWAARLRGVSVHDDFRQAFELLARYADDPVITYRIFVDDFVSQIDNLPAAITAGEPIHVDMTLTFVIPREVSKAYDAEFKRLRRKLAR